MRKLDPFQLCLLQGMLVYLYGLQLCENYKISKIEGASRQEILKYAFNIDVSTHTVSSET